MIPTKLPTPKHAVGASLTPAQAADYLRKMTSDLGPKSTYPDRCIEYWRSMWGEEYVAQVRKEQAKT